MIRIRFPFFKSIMIILTLVIISAKGFSQTTMPEELTKSSIKDQLNYLEQRTRIYENYRAIREDMFQMVKMNISDTLSDASNHILSLTDETIILNHRIDSLNTTLESTKNSLAEVTRTKNNIEVFGMEVNKALYNSIMWIIIAGLISILIIGFLAFKRNIIITTSKKRDLEELKNEFEDYRKTTREAREKMSMDHFNEVKRLKGQ